MAITETNWIYILIGVIGGVVLLVIVVIIVVVMYKRSSQSNSSSDGSAMATSTQSATTSMNNEQATHYQSFRFDSTNIVPSTTERAHYKDLKLVQSTDQQQQHYDSMKMYDIMPTMDK